MDIEEFQSTDTNKLSYKQLQTTVSRFERVVQILNKELDNAKIDVTIPVKLLASDLERHIEVMEQLHVVAQNEELIPPNSRGEVTLALSSDVQGSRDKPYRVNSVLFCECPDFQYNGNVCKHLFAIMNRHNTSQIVD